MMVEISISLMGMVKTGLLGGSALRKILACRLRKVEARKKHGTFVKRAREIGKRFPSRRTGFMASWHVGVFTIDAEQVVRSRTWKLPCHGPENYSFNYEPLLQTPHLTPIYPSTEGLAQSDLESCWHFPPHLGFRKAPNMQY